MKLIEFWAALKRTNRFSPLIHTEDVSLAGSVFTHCWPKTIPDESEFSAQLSNWGAPQSGDIHHYLVPQPYCGNLKSNQKKIYFLMLNPGFNPFDYAELSNEEFRNAAWSNLYQEELEYPFLFLNPTFWWHPGFAYWNSRFKWMLEIAKGENLADRQKWLSERVVSLEIFPYHTQGFGTFKHKTISDLPSVKQLVSYVKSLEQKAIAKKILIVVVRGKSHYWSEWKDKEEDNIVFTKSQQGSYISRDSTAGRMIKSFIEGM